MFQWTTYSEKPETVPPVNRVPIGESQYFRAVTRRRTRSAGLSGPSSGSLYRLPDFILPKQPLEIACEPGYHEAASATNVSTCVPDHPMFDTGGVTPFPGGDVTKPAEPTPGASPLGFLSGIPTTYLIGAVGLYFLMKKK